MFADLHLHTSFSDGTFSPEELVEHAVEVGLSAMAVTDHDSVDACARVEAACRPHGLEFVSGTELTADADGRELHLLAYYFDAGDQNFLRHLQTFQAGRQERLREMVSRINALGIDLPEEAVWEISQCRSPGRPHVARALVARGICQSFDEAFERFLKKDRPGWVPKFRISTAQAIELIHRAGGMVSLAHPGISQCNPLIPRLVSEGLDGLECFHSKHTPSATEYYLSQAAGHRLLATGGSDCHGLSKGTPLIGSVRLPKLHYDRLKEKAAARVASR